MRFDPRVEHRIEERLERREKALLRRLERLRERPGDTAKQEARVLLDLERLGSRE
jgi:hypothetical protein